MSDVLEAQVRQFLAATCAVAQPIPGYAYRGPADLLVQHGRAFTPQPLPRRYRRGLPHLCYDNAFTLAARTRGALRYCEGYAAGIIPVEHAWCIDAADRVVDPTWGPDIPREIYFGIEIPLREVRAARRRGGASALFDWLHGYPLCRVPSSTAP
jgi:hypothetical protein